MGRRILAIRDTFLPTIFGTSDGRSWAVEGAGLPADTKIVNAAMEFVGAGYQRLRLLLESEEWEPGEEGKPYPEIYLKFRAWTADGVPEASVN